MKCLRERYNSSGLEKQQMRDDSLSSKHPVERTRSALPLAGPPSSAGYPSPPKHRADVPTFWITDNRWVRAP